MPDPKGMQEEKRVHLRGEKSEGGKKVRGVAENVTGPRFGLAPCPRC